MNKDKKVYINKNMEYSKNDYVKCLCGVIYLKKNKYHHIRTIGHNKKLNINDEKINKSIDKKKEYVKVCYHRKIRIDCECGGYFTHSFYAHYKTNRHINFLIKKGIIEKPIYNLND